MNKNFELNRRRQKRRHDEEAAVAKYFETELGNKDVLALATLEYKQLQAAAKHLGYSVGRVKMAINRILNRACVYKRKNQKAKANKQ